MAYDILKGSTGTPIVFGPMVLSSDHITATGDLHTTVTVTISKNGGAFGSPSGAITWIGNGWYQIAGNATDSGTAGPIAVHASVATNDPFDQTVAFVVDPAVANFGVNVVNWLGTVVATPATAGIPDVNAKNINNATAVNGLTAAAIATGIWQDATAGDFTTSGSIGKSLFTSGNAPGAASGLALVGSNMGTITGALTAAQIATGVWTDITAGDFTVALSVGKSLMNGVTLGTGLTVSNLTNLPSIPANWITAAGINAAALNGKGDWLLASSYTAPTNLTASQIATGVWQDATAGDFTASLSVGKSVMNGVALGTGLTVNALTNAPTAGDLTATMKTSVQTAADAAITANATVIEIGADTDELVTGVIVTTNNDKTGYSTTDWTTALTESYRAFGAAPTPAQFVFELIGHLTNSNIVGTTKTVTKLDRATTAKTGTLDSATVPTKIAEAS